ncbi:MAG: patatin-like phospholipase family protein [Rhodobacterales bacterium]|nr:patatin-like phospholipase family protein [Rhodobacterales bacterium]NCT12521.1 patatin-like phospholipase family protein [Rhodobacterales bacterium]
MIRVNLALQGGGAHGAFTWGVLDRLLDAPDIEVAAISGTSAGAMNAAAFKAGMIAGGRAGARAELASLWEQVGAVTGPVWAAWLTALAPSVPALAQALRYSPAFAAVEALERSLSPYAFGPMLQNPLRRIVEGFRFEAVCASAGPALFIGATNVRSGKIKVFRGDEITPEAILASACLPTLFQAVEIEDPATGRIEAYWDGGYTGNPALFPLFAPDLPDDIVVVNVNPLYRDALPYDTLAIQNRINEISFNASLLREMRAIHFVNRLLGEGVVARGAKKGVLLHMIADDALMNDLNVATKTVAVPVILARLRDAGFAAADRFVRAHKGDLNQRSSVDMAAMFG